VVVKPNVWGFICTTAHPAGCDLNVLEQINTTKQLGIRSDGPKRALIIGASTGYGLAARITAAFGFGAATLGVFLEKPARGIKTGSAGWYNAVAFDKYAKLSELQSISINADAYSNATRSCAIDSIKQYMGGQVDLVIYSLASPARRLPGSGEVLHTSLKPIGMGFTGKTIDTDHDAIVDVHVEPASELEISDTIRVMGGEDWALWINALHQADALSDKAKTVAFSYIGPEATWPIYWHGTIGRAKQHLEYTAKQLQDKFRKQKLSVYVAMMKSVVTQASAAIPLMPLYISLIYRVMKDRGLHEGSIEQMNRLFRKFLYQKDGQPPVTDDQGRLRLDDLELRDDVQKACNAAWAQVTNENFVDITDYRGYKQEFLQLFGFARQDVDYELDVPVDHMFNCIQL
jgi:enoyl-[acyl-carrier protein] reductase / trans-2-enoyl-CoA reductase (NAD+)